MQCGSKSQKRALLSATHEIVLYVYLQLNRYGVDFLLYRESHRLHQTEFNCEIGLLKPMVDASMRFVLHSIRTDN